LTDSDFNKSAALGIMRDLKYPTQSHPQLIPIYDEDGEPLAHLQAVNTRVLEPDGEEYIRLLTDWRNGQDWIGQGSKVTMESTRGWVESQCLERKDRILFWIQTLEGKPIGHLGLNRFIWKKGFAEMDNLIRGEPELPTAMVQAYKCLRDWAFETLGIQCLFAELDASNRASYLVSLFSSFRRLYRTPAQSGSQESSHLVLHCWNPTVADQDRFSSDDLADFYRRHRIP